MKIVSKGYKKDNLNFFHFHVARKAIYAFESFCTTYIHNPPL